MSPAPRPVRAAFAVTRRVTVARFLVAAVVLGLSVVTVSQTVENSHQRRCYEQAAANRADANALDWAAMDKLIDAIVTSPGDQVRINDALREFQSTRVDTRRVREENQATTSASDQC